MSREEERSCENVEGRYVGIQDIQICEKLAKDAGYIFNANITQSSFETGCFLNTTITLPFYTKNNLNTVFFNNHNIDGTDLKSSADIYVQKDPILYQIYIFLETTKNTSHWKNHNGNYHFSSKDIAYHSISLFDSFLYEFA